MKKFLWGALLALALAIPVAVNADSTQTLLNAWKVVSGFIVPTNSANGLKVPSLANQNCIGTDGTGAFGAGTCSGGGGSSASTTIAGLSPSNGVFVLNGSSTSDTNITLSVSTTSPRTINLLPGWTGTLADGRIASAVNWNGVYNNVLSRLVVATGSAGTIFNISTSTNSLTINLPTASAVNTGQLSGADWTTFNNKVSTTRQVSAGTGLTGGGDLSADRTINLSVPVVVANGGTGTNTLASLTVGSNLSVSGGQNVLIGTSTQISLGSNVVTTVSTSSAGSSFSGSIAANTLTLNWPYASASISGQLQSGDWTTFNNKVTSVSGTSPITSTGGTTPAIGVNTGNLTLTSSNLSFGSGDGKLVLLGTTTNITLTDNPTFVKGIFTNASTTNLTASGNVYLTGLTGQNCLGTSAAGLLQAGSCGGGSGNSAWTIGNGLIYNATSTDLVGVGTSSPSSTLTVQGKVGTQPFRVASSTGSSMVSVESNGDLTVTSGAIQANSQILFNSAVFTQFQANVANVNLNFKTVAGTGDIVFTPNAVDTMYATHNQTAGVNTSTPAAILSVQGVNTSSNTTTPIFIVASSTKAVLFQVGATGSTTVNSLAASALVVTDANKALGSYGGASSCASGQAVIGLSALGGTTCSANGLQAALSGGVPGQATYWTSSSALGSSAALLTDGTVVGINATSSGVSLNIKGSGTQTPLIVASSSGTTILQVASTNKILINPSSSGKVASSAALEIDDNATGTNSDLVLNTVQGGASTLFFGNSRGTLASPATSTINDILGSVTFSGYDGTAYRPAAEIRGTIIATSTQAGAGRLGGTLVFRTGDAAGNYTTRMTLYDNGNLGIGTSTPGQLLDVWGNIQSSTGTTATLLTNTATQTLTVQNLVANGTLNVTGQTTLGNASSSAFTVSGLTNLATTTVNSYGYTANVIGEMTKTFGNTASTSVSTLTNNSYGTATSTFSFISPPYNVTFNSIACKLNSATGTVEFLIGNGTSSSTPLLVKNTVQTATPSINATSSTEFYWQAGSETNTADGLECTLGYRPN